MDTYVLRRNYRQLSGNKIVTMIRNLLYSIWQTFLTLNLYKTSSSGEQTLRREQLSTKIYVCSLFTMVLIIVTASAFVLRTVDKTEYFPSPTRFTQLMQKYSNTLRCPCAKVGITYGTFVRTNASFHQVCSSEFIEQQWIDLVFTERNSSTSLARDDVRRSLSFFWQMIAGFCDVSNRSWIDTARGFDASHMFNPVALTESVVRAQVQAVLNNQIALSRAALARNVLAFRRAISGNQIVSGLQTNFFVRYPPDKFGQWQFPKMTPRTFNDCSCISITGCPHPGTLYDSDNRSIPVPGMIADCLIIDSTLASTLECYYDLRCFSLIHPPLNNDTQRRLLNISNKNFAVNASVQMLLDEMMIDEWKSEIEFSAYYSTCNPSYCSYSYTHRFDILFIITTAIGIFGGVSFAIRLMAPWIATLILRWKNRNLPAADIQQKRLAVIWKSFRESIVNLNLFEKESARTPVNIHRELFLTRFFLLLITIFSVAFGFYLFLVEQNQVITIAHPSLSTYQQLYHEHSTVLQCPCSQLSVPYGSFLNVSFVLHQVCSSDLISTTWLKYLASFDPTHVYSWTETYCTRDFRTTGASYFQLLATFCSLVQINIADAQDVFRNTQFINDRVLPPPIFAQQSQAMIQSLIQSTRNDFARVLNWINVAFVTAQFLTGANTNFRITVDANEKVTTDDVSYGECRLYPNGFVRIGACSCTADQSRCQIFDVVYINTSSAANVPQLFVEPPIGCMPLKGFFFSKIRWWYNITYLEYIRTTYSTFLDSPYSPTIKSLNGTVSSRFGDISMSNLLDQMLIERYIGNETHFEQFYHQCAPSSCSYTIVRRRDLLVLLLLFISMCGGLNKGLRILVPLFGKLIWISVRRWKNRSNERQLTLNNNRRKDHLNNLVQSIRNINLFQTASTDEIIVHRQKIYTRVYVLLFTVSLSILLFYTALVQRSVSKTYSSPTVSIYEHLRSVYPNSVNCPCTQIAIPYNAFVTQLYVSSFHQACSTDAIDTAISCSKRLVEGVLFIYGNDFDAWKAPFITSLAQICTLAQDSVEDSIRIFYSSTMLANQLIPRVEFFNEMADTLDQFQQKTSIVFAATLDLIRSTIQANALMAIYSSNWKLSVAEKGQGRNATFLSTPVSYERTDRNSTCSCATLRTCTMPAQILNTNGTVKYTIEGLVFGCHLFETVLLSSLSCFYSLTCINGFRQMLTGYYLTLEQCRRNGYTIQLNASQTRFAVNDTVETLAKELFIESWISNVSYEHFFNSCAPNYCIYTYRYRFDTLELLTTFLSVFAGLSLGLRFLVPYLVETIVKIRHRFRIAPA